MKKQFFYAAFAIAMMASCTSEENLPVEQTPEEDKVAINLGIDAPSVNAEIGGRGTGSVGDVAGDNNYWNGQKLSIVMIDRETKVVAKDPANLSNDLMSWNTYNYMAPRVTEQGGENDPHLGSGNIRIYQLNATPTTPEGNGTIQYLYYPTQGTFDFYGWHTDDADGTPSVVKTEDNKTEITVSDITINGTQDVMGAKTKEFTDANYTNYIEELKTWAFSARTARNEIDPILAFEHKLARLKFFVKAGSYSAALYDKYNNKKSLRDDNDDTSTGAMYITSIKAKNMHSKFNMILNETDITTSVPTDPIEFKLGDRGTDGKIGELEAKAANYHKDYVPEGETGENQVGEAMMFLPVAGSTEDKITLELGLKQYLQQTDVEDSEDDDWAYRTETATVVVKAEDLVKAANQTADVVKRFVAGYSYNVYITIYGFERIEVSAELTPWEMGGDVDVDIEEDTEENDDTDEPSTPTTKEFNFTAEFPEGVTGLTAEFSVTEVVENGTGTTVEKNENGSYDLTIGKKYNIVATATDDSTSKTYSKTLEYEVTGQDDENTNIEINLEEVQE